MLTQESSLAARQAEQSRKELRLLYSSLQNYVGWSDDDVRRVIQVGKLVESYIPQLIDDFYHQLQQHPPAAKVITGGEEQIQRLKATLANWMAQLFAGVYDDEYVLNRWQVGWRHVEIGLEQIYCNVALTRLRVGVIGRLGTQWNGSSAELAEMIASFSRLIDLDLAIIDRAYHDEMQARQERTQRLATIGKVAGGIAHELRNPLNVIKLSIYYLLHANSVSPEKLNEHLIKIDRQVGACDKVISAISDFAKLGSRRRETVDLVALLHETIANEIVPAGINVRVEGLDQVEVAVDPRQLQIVFGNLLRNAFDAMTQPHYTSKQSAVDRELAESESAITGDGDVMVETLMAGNEVVVRVADHGHGILPDDLARISEPLFTTKSRGIGLGLAITKAILDKHSARLEVTSEIGKGTTFSVVLPTTLTDRDA